MFVRLNVFFWSDASRLVQRDVVRVRRFVDKDEGALSARLGWVGLV